MIYTLAWTGLRLSEACGLQWAEQLGHSTIQTTVDLYGHVKPGKNHEAVDRLAALTQPSNSEDHDEVARK